MVQSVDDIEIEEHYGPTFRAYSEAFSLFFKVKRTYEHYFNTSVHINITNEEKQSSLMKTHVCPICIL